MKRTNLVLDGDLLEEATRLSGAKTYSGAVNEILSAYVKRAKARQLLSLTGSGAWEGVLSEMRNDSNGEIPASSTKRAKHGNVPR